MLYALFIGEKNADSSNPDAWNYGVGYDDLIETIERVLGQVDMTEGDEMVIRVQAEEEEE